jgi:hypothetical protein
MQQGNTHLHSRYRPHTTASRSYTCTMVHVYYIMLCHNFLMYVHVYVERTYVRATRYTTVPTRQRSMSAARISTTILARGMRACTRTSAS